MIIDPVLKTHGLWRDINKMLCTLESELREFEIRSGTITSACLRVTLKLHTAKKKSPIFSASIDLDWKTIHCSMTDAAAKEMADALCKASLNRGFPLNYSELQQLCAVFLGDNTARFNRHIAELNHKIQS